MSTQGDRRTMRRNIRELPRPAWFLISGNVVNWFASFAIPFLVLYLKQRGFSTPKAGLALAAYGLGEMGASALAGHLADRVGRRTILVSSMFGSAATILFLYFVRPYPAILGMALLAGVATEGWRPASRALMADLVPEGQRVTAFAMVRFAGHISFAVGGAVAGLLADQSFLWVFVADAVSSAAFGVMALIVLPQGHRVSRSQETERGGGYRAALADRAFVLFLVATAVAMFVYFQGLQGATLPVHVENNGLRPSDFGLLLFLNGILVVLFELPLSSITMRRPPRQMVALGYFLIGVGFALTAFAHSLTMLLVTVGVWTLGEMVSAPVAYAYVADLAPEHMRGRYQGLFGVFFSTGSVTGPAIGTLLFTLNATAFWGLCGVLGAVAAALVLATPRTPASPWPEELPIVLPTSEPTSSSTVVDLDGMSGTFERAMLGRDQVVSEQTTPLDEP
jgi:MFS family permease